jgi:hypothetical protein
MSATMINTAWLSMDPPARSEDRMPQLICGLFVLIGGLFLAWGVAWFLQTALFLGQARPGTGVVVGERRSTSVRLKGQSAYREVSTTRSPVVEFHDGAGVRHRFVPLASSQQSFETGERVPVLYDPRQPGQAHLRSFDALWMRPILLVGFGGSMAGLSAWIWVMFQRQVQPEQTSRARRRG